MAKKKRKEPSQDQQQPYDNLLKSLLEGQEHIMLPYFLAGVEYLSTLNIEVLRTPLRVDRVYQVKYQEKVHILHLEFESGPSNAMASRLLDYHAYLYHKYHHPVISIVVYLFCVKMAESPLRESSGDRELLTFHFWVFPLWQLKADVYVQEHAVPMYALLPAMQNANARLLNQAIDEMVKYYENDNIKLAQELRWMGIMLRRAEIVSSDEKREIEERLSMYDELIEQDPKMKKIRAESEARGRTEGLAEGLAKGIARGKAEGLQEAVVSVVEGRFPPLAELAQQKVVKVKKPDALDLLLKALTVAPDEMTARVLLESLIS